MAETLLSASRTRLHAVYENGASQTKNAHSNLNS